MEIADRSRLRMTPRRYKLEAPALGVFSFSRLAG
jgi:hypothetical protein